MGVFSFLFGSISTNRSIVLYATNTHIHSISLRHYSVWPMLLATRHTGPLLVMVDNICLDDTLCLCEAMVFRATTSLEEPNELPGGRHHPAAERLSILDTSSSVRAGTYIRQTDRQERYLPTSSIYRF